MSTKVSASKKNVKNGKNTSAENNTAPWMQKMAEKSAESAARLMETGQFFNGLPGKDHKVRAIFLDDEPREAITKNGSDVWQFQVFRVSSKVEQTMSILMNLTSITDQIYAIAAANGNHLKDVWIDVEFIKGAGTLNYIKTITQVTPATITKEPTIETIEAEIINLEA